MPTIQVIRKNCAIIDQCQRELQVFEIYFWNLAGWSHCNDALFAAVRLQTTHAPHMACACDTHMESKSLSQGLWDNDKYITVKTLRGSSTYKST